MDKRTPICGLVLAAGLGTRLKPLTDHMPKPLLPVCGRPLIDKILSDIRRAGVDRIAVNTHHLAVKMHAHLADSPLKKILQINHEPVILGTGGPLVNCRTLFEDYGHLLLHNGDILTDINLQELVRTHMDSGATATMALIDGPENRVHFRAGEVVDILGEIGTPPSADSRSLTYAGISIYSGGILKYLPREAKYFSLVKFLLEIIRGAPGSVRGYLPEGVYWNDIGTLGQYFKAHNDIIVGRKLKIPGARIRGNISCGAGSRISKRAVIQGFASVGSGCRIGGAHLKNCIISDGTAIPDGARYGDEFICGRLSVHSDTETLRNLAILKGHAPRSWRTSTLAEQGSSRKFYRLCKGSSSRILMLSSTEDKDYERYVRLGQLFHKHRLGTPKIYDHDSREFTVLMEDLGSDILYDIMSTSTMEDLYMKVIGWLVNFQVTAAANEDEFRRIVDREFDYEGLKWETDYFRDNFLIKYLGVRNELAESFEPEFHLLALEALKQPQTLVHRDFQSQNILIRDGRVRIVDFQGARFGPACYDIMALLRDPYVRIPDAMRSRLMRYYLARLASSRRIPEKLRFSEPEFAKFAVYAGLQRSMQALGAYGFLSLAKGKTQFMQYIPEGVRNLKALIRQLQGIHGAPLSLSGLLELLEGDCKCRRPC